jgi:hypothetical protein
VSLGHPRAEQTSAEARPREIQSVEQQLVETAVRREEEKFGIHPI